jgi:hypothetical protein
MFMKHVSTWIAVIALVYMIYYVFTLQWEDAGESVYYGGLIFMMAFLVEEERRVRKQRRVRL